ncbi:MAG: double zinc ribbon domain-containing protein [Geminicoccaceae bacterium]
MVFDLSWRPAPAEWFKRGLDLVLPPRCHGCGSVLYGDDGLCGDCWGRLTFIAPPFCRICGFPLPGSSVDQPLCAGCAAKPPVFDRARAALRYDNASRHYILRFKNQGRLAVQGLFARWLHHAGTEILAETDVIVPVPLHRWKLFRRGFNQAALLAQRLASRTGHPVEVNAFRRIQATQSQKGLGGNQRLTNITAQAFGVAPERPASFLDQRVLLIDDVLTTGATASACANALKRAGALSVDVLSLARVVRSG